MIIFIIFQLFWHFYLPCAFSAIQMCKFYSHFESQILDGWIDDWKRKKELQANKRFVAAANIVFDKEQHDEQLSQKQ